MQSTERNCIRSIWQLECKPTMKVLCNAIKNYLGDALNVCFLSITGNLMLHGKSCLDRHLHIMQHVVTSLRRSWLCTLFTS
uniref:Uncharacterized protein n=1 Tax=Romanomermis culicivorax TaxID=13658 RepID=A0A915JS86_ROMCU